MTVNLELGRMLKIACMASFKELITGERQETLATILGIRTQK
jgi:hypothetical protein